MSRSYKHIIQEGAQHTSKSPSDNVWISIEQELFPKKRRAIVYLLFPSILLAIMLIYLSFTGTSSKSGTSIDNEAYTITSGAYDNFDISNEQNTEPIRSFDDQHPQSIQEQIDVIVSRNEQSKYVENTGQSIQNDNVHKKIINKNSASEFITASKKESTTTEEIFKQISASKAISEIQILQIPLLLRQKIEYNNKTSINSEYIDTFNPMIEPLHRTNKTLGLQLGYHHNLFNSTIETDNPLAELVEYAHNQDFASVQLSASFTISDKLELNSGVGYFRSKASTNYDINLKYSALGELHDATTAEYYTDFQHSLPSLGGDLNTELSLRRADNSSIQLEEEVGIDLQTTVIDHSIFIPLSLRYYVHNKEGIFFEGGVIGGYVINRQLAVDQIDASHNTIYLSNASVATPNISNKFSLQSTTGIGFAKSLSENIQFSSSINYNTSLQQGVLAKGYLTTNVGFRFTY